MARKTNQQMIADLETENALLVDRLDKQQRHIYELLERVRKLEHVLEQQNWLRKEGDNARRETDQT